MLYEHSPVEDVAEYNLHSCKVRRSVAYEKECVAVSVGRVDGNALHINARGLHSKLLQLTLNLTVREVRLDIQEVVVVLEHNTLDVEHRMVVLVLVDGDVELTA